MLGPTWSRCENSQKLTQLSSRSHPRHLGGGGGDGTTAQKVTTTDITSDNLVNSNFPHRWSPASLTLNHFFYLYIYIYIYYENNHKQQRATSKITKEPKQKSRLGTASNEITGGLKLVCGRPILALGSVLVHQTKQLRTRKQNEQNTNEKHSGQLALKGRWPQC